MPSRRQHLRTLAASVMALKFTAPWSAAAALLSAPALASSRRVLAPMSEGPFYPPRAWRERWEDADADLTRVQQGSQVLQAQGEPLGLQMVLADTQGRLIDGAEIEIWQCDAFAHYRHPRVPVVAGRHDPGFQGLGSGRSDTQGALRFRTIRPVAYPGRTPHIHLKLRHASFGELTTQLFVEGDPGNAGDFLWRRVPAADRAGLAMKLQPAAAASGLRWQAQQVLTVPA
jgi:protocatechuate 3,4-dioxygenase beta subunit